jgi:hypothetical protein
MPSCMELRAALDEKSKEKGSQQDSEKKEK